MGQGNYYVPSNLKMVRFSFQLELYEQGEHKCIYVPSPKKTRGYLKDAGTVLSF